MIPLKAGQRKVFVPHAGHGRFKKPEMIKRLPQVCNAVELP
jgi:hypothetical protein